PPRPPFAPTTEAVRMIAPPSGMTGMACLTRKNAPLSLMLKWLSKKASSTCAIGANLAMPALTNRTSMRPCLVLTWSTRTLAAATLPASESSTSIPGSAALAASTERSLEPVTTTVAPWDWKSLAVSAPIPLVPPLMRAILPSSLAMKVSCREWIAVPKRVGTAKPRAMAPAPAFAGHYHLRHLEAWPAPVFFVPPGALLARVVQEPLRDVLPDRLPAIEADRVGGLHFHGPLATATGDPQDVALDLRETALPHLGGGRAGARISQHRVPIFRRQRFVWSRSRECRLP